MSTEFEDTFNNTDFMCCGIQSTKTDPVIHQDSSTDHITTTIHRSSDQWDLQERWEFFLFLDRRLRVNKTTLIGEHTVTTDEYSICDSLSKAFDIQCID